MATMAESVVIVVMDGNRSKANLDAISWAMSNVVRPKDTLLVLGIIRDSEKKTSCLPFNLRKNTIWERLVFSATEEVTPQVLEDEIKKKKQEYQFVLQPFYQQCKKNGVKLEVKLAAGFSPNEITVEEAQSTKTRWIVLDSKLKNGRFFIKEHVRCNVAVMKGHDVATILSSMPAIGEDVNVAPDTANDSGSTHSSQPQESNLEELDISSEENGPPPESSSPTTPTHIHSLPSQWPGFPREFFFSEVEEITNGFADENFIMEEENFRIYSGVLLGTPVLVKCFSGGTKQFLTELNILKKVRHRNILNLLGYCCLNVSTMFLICEYPYNASLDYQLRSSELACKLSWRIRSNIALGVGKCLRYLHEECPGGPICHLSLSSSNVLLSQSYMPLLANFGLAKWVNHEEALQAPSLEEPIGNMLQEGECLSCDVYSYGLLLLKLLTGRTLGEGPSLEEWAIPFIENGSMSQIIDPRLKDSCDEELLRDMAHAALLCIKSDSRCQLSMSRVVSIVEGNQFMNSRC
ncbi:probable receptor-like protein kinase At1g80640 isoform X1 [Amborella trichopoda]|uniref:probable receptor-like protein kinase At1g80640 isoform X1 n=1 Tax=Amborella trichopoda TaxID=13333 RepID=UPI0009BCBCC5|nr:probable receptor-like protein kinase At1g80640 isoform X1 [Amborella trichopoda]|eukprot:XP_020524457.1 probable receptor-like protein kinase At1g80640 isoform X1 [Amborella trichopoda]